jgi:hypothetical protein
MNLPELFKLPVSVTVLNRDYRKLEVSQSNEIQSIPTSHILPVSPICQSVCAMYALYRMLLSYQVP